MLEPGTTQLTVSVLAEQAGLPVSTIRYYVREGLLPPGQRRSSTRILYGPEHLLAIKRIKSLRDAGVPITDIRSRAPKVPDAQSDADVARARRDDVLEAATSCFLSDGFAGTSLGAIARAASLSKATLSGYFSSKEEIFMACAERVFNRLYAEVWPVIAEERGPGERLRTRWDAFVKSFGDWAPMMDLVRGLAVGSPAFRAEYLRLATMMTAPIARELSMLEGGAGADRDAELEAYVVLGKAEAAARAVKERGDDPRETWEHLESLLARLIGGGGAPSRAVDEN